MDSDQADVEITVKLKIKDVNIDLSYEDAKKLFEKLETLFTKKVQYVDRWFNKPYWTTPVPSYPHVWYTNNTGTPDLGNITCKTEDTTAATQKVSYSIEI
jgi:hypothetical protein